MTSAPRIAAIHTVFAVGDDLERRWEAAGLPAAQHVVDTSLLTDLLAGADRADVTRRLEEHIDALDADVVVVSCSSLTPSVEQLREGRTVQIIAIDEPMAVEAVAEGRVGVLCTTTSTVEGSTRLLERAADHAGRSIELSVRLVEGAFAALQSGDRTRHDELVCREAASLAPDVDIIVLAQASLARLDAQIATLTGLSVLSSPPLLIAELRRRIAAD